MFLILLWPAAIPRLFIPLIPFFIIALTVGLETYNWSPNRIKETFRTAVVALFLLLIIYVIGQYFLKLQFLVMGYEFFTLIIFIQLLSIFFLFFGKRDLFLLSLVFSMVTWSAYSIGMHRDILRSVKEASEYASNHLEGKIAYNDTSAIPDWYLNVSESDFDNSGVYVIFDKREYLEFDKLNSKKIDYLIISNEHNPNISVNLEKRKYLQLIKEFSYNVNGTDFYAKVIKFDPDYK